MLLVDASVWVASTMPANRWHDLAGELVRKPPQPLAALDLTLYEIANGVGAQCGDRQGATTLAQVVIRRCHRRILGLDVELLDETVALAAEQCLSAYDAAYVAVARRNGWQLVSIDHRDLVSKGLAVTPDAALYP